MKKLLVVFTAILVVAFAVPAMAMDRGDIRDMLDKDNVPVGWGGEFTFGGITNFQEDEITNVFGNAYLDMFIHADEFNIVLFELFTGVETTGAGHDLTVSVFYLETDIGGYAGLPVGLKVRGGRSSIYSRKFEVTGHDTERPIRPFIDGVGLFGTIDLGMAVIDLGIGFESNFGDDGIGGTADDAPNQDYAALVSLPDVAGILSAEAGYFIIDNDDFKGAFTVNAKALGIADMIDAAAAFTYDVAGEDAGKATYYWGAGVLANVSMFGIGVGINGMEDNLLSTLTLDVNAGVTDSFGVDVGLGLGFGDVDFGSALEKDTFTGFDASVYYDAGPGQWRIGYLYQASDIADDTYSFRHHSRTPDLASPIDGSGIYVAADINF